MLEIARRFRERVARGERVLGTFVKTPAHQTIEILALAGLDFVVLDVEHAPFGLPEIDRCILAASATELAVLVRPSPGDARLASACLDLGAAGIVMPHVKDAKSARSAVAAVRFSAGRGLSPSPRAGAYGGHSFANFARESDRSVSLWVQIEDPAGATRGAEIMAVDGIDALFVGRVDLAFASGLSSIQDPQIGDLASRLVNEACRADKAGALFVAPDEALNPWEALGANVFVIGTDQGLLRSAAIGLVSRLHG